MTTTRLLVLFIGLLLAQAVRAVTITETFSRSFSLSSGIIIDNNATLFELNEAWAIQSISDIQVSLKIEGTSSPAPNGDLTASLLLGATGTGFAVLFDGATLTPTAQGLVGLDVTFSDGAAQNIQDAPGALVGTYAAYESLLAAFGGLDPRDSWFLNITDGGFVGESALITWEIQITGDDGTSGVPVPEQIHFTSWFAFLGLLGFHAIARRRRTVPV